MDFTPIANRRFYGTVPLDFIRPAVAYGFNGFVSTCSSVADPAFEFVNDPSITHRALRRVAVRIERVDGAHACVSPRRCSCSAIGESAGDGCSPAFSSQIEMIGTNFEKST